jgi:hypothetical protein
MIYSVLHHRRYHSSLWPWIGYFILAELLASSEVHSWTDAKLQLVNLRPFTAARRKLRRLTSTDSRSTLSTDGCQRAKLHSYGSVPSNTSVLCNRIETQNHVFQFPQRAEWRYGFMERTCPTRTPTNTLRQILTSTESWLLDEASACNYDERKP